MNLWEKFGKHIIVELEKVKFEEMYNAVYQEGSFSTSQLSRVILLTIFLQEYYNKTEWIPQLANYLSLIKNEPDEITYDALLYVISLCHKIYIQRKHSSLEDLVMYC